MGASQREVILLIATSVKRSWQESYYYDEFDSR